MFTGVQLFCKIGKLKRHNIEKKRVVVINIISVIVGEDNLRGRDFKSQ